MSLQNIKNLKSDKGFTIVELLIVIVIIGILAAITIVAYNGIQNRGKTSAAAATAATVSKKAEAANALASGYPVAATGTNSFASNNDSSLAGSGITLLAAAPTSTAATNAVFYQVCTAGGPATGLAKVLNWNYTNGSNDTSYLGGTSASTCTTWTTVSGGPF